MSMQLPPPPPIPAVVTTLPQQQGLGALATAIVATRQTAGLLLGNRLPWVLQLILLLFATMVSVLAGSERNQLDGRELFCLFAWWLVLGVVSPWLTIYLAAQAVHAGLEDRTSHYLFLRPVRRWPLLLGHWLAVALHSAAAGVLGCGLLFVGVAMHPTAWSTGVEYNLFGTFAALAALAAVAYAAFGVLLAATLRRPLLFGSLAVVLQMVVALLPASAGLRSLTIADPLRRLLLDWLDPNTRLLEMLWPGERELRSATIGMPLWSLLLFTGVSLALAMLAYSRGEYDARPRE